jgi:hypothetical protein
MRRQTWTLSRQQEVDFSLMTFVDGATVLVRGNSNCCAWRT